MCAAVGTALFWLAQGAAAQYRPPNFVVAGDGASSTQPTTVYLSAMAQLTRGGADFYFTERIVHFAQPFETGSRRGGYRVAQVYVALTDNENTGAVATSIYTATSTDGRPPPLEGLDPLWESWTNTPQGDRILEPYAFAAVYDSPYIPRDRTLALVLNDSTISGNPGDAAWSTTASNQAQDPGAWPGWRFLPHHFVPDQDGEPTSWSSVANEIANVSILYGTEPVFDGEMTVGSRTVGGIDRRGFVGTGSGAFGSVDLGNAYSEEGGFAYGSYPTGDRYERATRNVVTVLYVTDDGVRLDVQWQNNPEMAGQTDLVLELGGVPLPLDDADRTTEASPDRLKYVWDQDYLDANAPLLNAAVYTTSLPTGTLRALCLRTIEQTCSGVTLISNVQVGTASPEATSVSARAQAFTTGANPSGYGLAGAKVAFAGSHTQSASSAVLLRIFSADADGIPGVELGRLIGPDAISPGLNTFTAAPNTVLDPGTSYALVITGSPPVGSEIISSPVPLSRTQTTSTDPQLPPGWSMAPTARFDDADRWASTDFLPVFSLRGTVRDPETVTEVWSATVNIGATSDGTVDGYCDGPCFGESSMESFGSLADDSGFGGQPHSVESIRFDTSFDPDRLLFTVVNAPEIFQANDDGLLLRIGITDYDLNDLRWLYQENVTNRRYEWDAASTIVPVEARPWNDAATSTAVVKLIRRAASTAATSTATSTGPSFAGCDGTGIWCATVEAGHHDDGSDYANDYYGYVAPGAGTIVDGSAEFTYDGEAYTVTVAGRREGGGADTYVIGIDPEPTFDFVLGVDGRTLSSTASSNSTATSTDGMSAGVVYAWPGGTGTGWGVGDRFDIGLRETAATIASATSTVVTITAENTYPVLHGDSSDALEYQLERTATDGDLSVWVDLSSGAPEFVQDGDRRKKVDFADGESTATLRIPAWQLIGIPEFQEVIEGGAVVARLAEGSAYTVGTPGAAEERVVVWVLGFDARNYEVDERDGKVAVSLTARYVGGGLPAPAFSSMRYLSVSTGAIGNADAARSPEDYAALSDVIAFPEDSTGPDQGFSDVDGDGTYETTRTFDQGIVWDAETEDRERFVLYLEITPGLALSSYYALSDGRRCSALSTSNPDWPDGCHAIVTIDDSPRTVIENVSIISAPAAAPDTYGAGERIMAAVRFAADVTVAVSSATSTATATMQVGTDDVKLPYKYQKSADTVVFGPYEVQPADMDADGVDLQRSDNPFIGTRVDSSSFQIVADGIAIRDTNGDEVFPYARLPNAGVFAQHKVDGSLEPPPVLVSNTGLGHFRLATDGASAQGFHTGGSAPAEDEPGDEREVVTVHSVGILVEGCSACPADPAQARVRVYRAGPNAYTPAGEPLFALTAPASVATSTVARFTAPEDAVLRADADYHLVFDDADGGTFPWALPVTNGNAEDAHSQPGWTIADVRGSRLAEGSVWTSRTFVAIFDIRGATSTVANIPATGKPRILGGAREGVPMTVDTSAIADGNGMATAEFEYSWSATTTRGVFDPVAGATADTYTPDAADVGKHIAVGVAFTDDVGYPESSISDFTPPVASSTRPNLEPTGTPTILGPTMPRVGDTLTADASAVMDEDGTIGVVFAYEWIDADAPPGGDPLGTGPQYHLQPGDEDRTIMLRVKYVDNLGLPNTIDSVATMAVAAQPEDNCRPDRIQLWESASSTGASTQRITGGPYGDIRYCHNNEYRDVCDDEWDKKDAHVACRQAGYHSAQTETKLSHFRDNDTVVSFWLDEVECTGAEATLGLCAHDGWGVSNCQFSERAGVRCRAAGSKTLSALSLTDADGNAVVLSSVWEDEFDPVVADYTARVASSTTVAVVVAATSTDPAATVTIDRTAATTTVTATVPFEDGTVLPITVRVTATGGATMDYRIVVARGDGATAIATATSTDATLRALTVNDGTNDVTLAPPFASSTHVYTAAVGNATTTVTLTATVNHPGASVTGVTLGGTAVADDEFFDGITIPSLVEGDNVIVVTVTAEDASTQDYTVTVSRARRTTTTPTLPAEVEVANDWSLIPSGLVAGDKFRLLFLSSTKTDGTSYDIADYNTFVQGRAAAGHPDIQAYSAGFRAVGCTADSDARDNTGTTGTGVVIHWLDGTKVADDNADFYNENWDNEANDKNELGNNGPNTSQSVNYPLTGCKHIGTEAFSGSTSEALGAPGGSVRVGRPNSSGSGHGPIGSNQTTADTNNRPMYGLSQVFEATGSTATSTATSTIPTIAGPAQVGRTLSVGTDDIVDPDGLTSSTYGYQWIRVDGSLETDIGTATTTSTYTPGADDLGKKLKVRVSFTDDASNPETRLSAETSVVVPAASTSCPADSVWCGTLTAGVGAGRSLIGLGTDAGRDAEDFGSVSPPTFTHSHPHLGTYTFRQIFATAGTGGNLLFQTSPALPDDGAGLTLHVQTISGERDFPFDEAVSYESVTVLSDGKLWRLGDLWSESCTDHSGLPLLRGGYSRCDAPYDVTDEDTEIGLRLTYANRPATSTPTITGTAQVGATLTADPSGITDADGLTGVSYTYRWIRVDGGTETPISGATSDTYVPVAADVGRQVKVEVTFADDGDNTETLESDPYPSGGTIIAAVVGSVSVKFASSTYSATEGGSVTVRVQLSDTPASPVTIPLTRRNLGGATNADYSGFPTAGLTFGTSDTSQTFTLLATDDSVDDDDESVEIGFGTLPSGVVEGSPATATVSLVDNDAAPPTVRFGAPSYTATEGGAAAMVTVYLSEAVGSSTTIPLIPTNRGGATDADYTGVPLNVTFGAAQTSRTFTVTAVDDSDNDRGESVRIGFGTLPPGVAPGSPATATVALEDDDSWEPPTVSFAAATYKATEGGGAVTVTVEVDRAEVPFTLPLTRDGQGGATSSDYSGVPSSVVFRGSDTAKSFTVTAVDDKVDDDGESVVIGFGAPLPAGLSLRIGSPSEATVELVDNDVPSASGALRLVGGDRSYGRLQVYHDGRWGLVCEGNFGREEAQVACRQLGYVDGEEGFGGAGSGGLPFWLKGVQCDGTEPRLVECLHRGLQAHYCGSFDIAGVECSETLLSVTDARVSGALLTLVYDAALDAGSVPSGGDFVVLAGASGGASAVAVESVAVAGDAVVLTLARPVLADETVRLSYLVAPMHPVQDARGTAAAPLTDRTVRNTTPTAAPDRVAVPDVVVSLGEAPLPAPDLALLPAPPRPALDLSPLLADAGASAPLGRLDLSSRTVADLSALAALAGLTELRVLRLDDNRVVDVGPLAALTGLRVLDLSSNAIADVGPLAALTGLERLDLSDNRIADLSALSALTGLEVLLLDGNRVADVVPLWSLQRLVHLGLAGNRIADVALVAELASLQRLDLSRNAVSDVSPLGDLAKLVWLRLPGNAVVDASPLGRLTLLRWLWLDAESDARGLLDADARRAAAPLWVGRVAAPEPAAAR